MFPWGDRFSGDVANGGGMGGRDRWAFTAPVGSFPANPHGLFDMVGNVWEWTSDWFRTADGWTQPAAAPPAGSAAYLKTVRGGSWDSSTHSLRVSRRVGLSPSDRHNLYVGFRCARAAAQAPTGSHLTVRGSSFYQGNTISIGRAAAASRWSGSS
jgi:formylglycine-generating enzyme required for sulfatase activity